MSSSPSSSAPKSSSTWLALTSTRNAAFVSTTLKMGTEHPTYSNATTMCARTVPKLSMTQPSHRKLKSPSFAISILYVQTWLSLATTSKEPVLRRPSRTSWSWVWDWMQPSSSIWSARRNWTRMARSSMRTGWSSSMLTSSRSRSQSRS